MKKGQAAMEFLLTYGWAILVVIVAIAALAYFGLSPGGVALDNYGNASNLNECDSFLLIGCFEGCQYASKAVFGITPIKDNNDREDLFDDCTNLCDEKYGVEVSS